MFKHFEISEVPLFTSGSPLIIDVEEDRPTFIRINLSSSEPMNNKGKNWFLLHMSGRKVEQNMLDVLILGCASYSLSSSPYITCQCVVEAGFLECWATQGFHSA